MLLDRFHRKFYHSKHRTSPEVGSSEDVTMVDDSMEADSFQLSQPVPVTAGNRHGESLGLYGQGQEFEESEEMMYVDPGVHTPVSTTPLNRQEDVEGLGGSFPPYLQMQGRQRSVSSLASSVSDFHGGLRHQAFATAAAGGAGSFTPQFLSLLLQVYQDLSSDPTVTPFDKTNPPSAILNKAAKIAIEQCRTQGVEIGYERNSWLLTLVRHRLLEEVRMEGFYSRNNSNLSLAPPPPQFVELMYNSSFQNSKPSTPDCAGKPTAQDYFGNVLSANAGRTGLMRSRSNSSQILLARTRSNSNGLFALTPASSECCLAPGFNGAAPSVNTNHGAFLSRQRSNTALSNSPATTAMAATCNHPSLENSIVSETLRKKRESLRLKR
ncbi:hypothetical protein HG536_0B05960 [Torulaspora globosa]|uniref:Uncharacterized protein n=1 Tax=Torulaspora globosa TaxID=48254 RepID=A0A7G3ZDZ4_9SACH|nr:uncharacterized protein HG536_0B05960 [Torulaspora globosa]QLL31730.1 hypothetical protein HG536_0B05960 [Torulaspora globosa]